MPLENALANVPGLAGALGMQQYREQQQAGQLSQASQLIGLENAMRQQGRQQQYEQAIGALGPDATQEQLIGIASKYGSPSDVLKVHQASLDRQGRLEQMRQTAEYQHELKMSQARTNEERAAETARHNKEMERLTGMLRTTQANKPPPGYRFTPDGNLSAIPGGPADQKLQGQFNQDTSMYNSGVAGMDRLAAAANELKNHPGLQGITGMRGSIPNVPGSAAANAQALLDNLKSQVGFGVLQEMRNNSKTGGALGQVSDKENQLLQDNLAALSRSQSYEEYQKNLQKIIDYTEGAKDRYREAYNRKYNTAAGASSAVAERPQPAPAEKPRKKPSEMTAAELAARRRELTGEK